MKKRKSISTIIFVLVFLIGLSVMLYPTVSDMINSVSQSKSITGYQNDVSLMNEKDYSKLLEAANAYNRTLVGNDVRFLPTQEETAEYMKLLNIGQTGVLGYIEIDKIDVHLPIYHSVSNAVLEIGVGHIEGSSLPIGGTATHSILSGHRGLPSARLFTDLDKLEIGDTFVLKVLDETLTYEVVEIKTVEPSEVESLEIDRKKDLCTLVTCTPYGVNSHRLLVTGSRVDNEMTDKAPTRHITADAIQIEPLYVAPVLAVPLLAILLLFLLARYRKTHRA